MDTFFMYIFTFQLLYSSVREQIILFKRSQSVNRIYEPMKGRKVIQISTKEHLNRAYNVGDKRKKLLKVGLSKKNNLFEDNFG